MDELEKLEKMELVEEKEYNFFVENYREIYYWSKPWYNPNIYVLSGCSIFDLISNIFLEGDEIKELKRSKLVDFGDDWALFKKGKKLIMVMVFADDIEQDEIKVTVRILVYS